MCEQGRFEEALKDYTAAIQLNPRHCRAFYNRAFSNDRLRRYDAAVSDYTRALDIQPGNATAYHNRASLFERLGRLVLSPASSTLELSSSPKHCQSEQGFYMMFCLPRCQTALILSYTLDTSMIINACKRVLQSTPLL